MVATFSILTAFLQLFFRAVFMFFPVQTHRTSLPFSSPIDILSFIDILPFIDILSFIDILPFIAVY